MKKKGKRATECTSSSAAKKSKVEPSTQVKPNEDKKKKKKKKKKDEEETIEVDGRENSKRAKVNIPIVETNDGVTTVNDESAFAKIASADPDGAKVTNRWTQEWVEDADPQMLKPTKSELFGLVTRAIDKVNDAQHELGRIKRAIRHLCSE